MTQPAPNPRQPSDPDVRSGPDAFRPAMLRMPENTAQLRDARLTPDDFTPVEGPVTRQGIDLRDPRVAQAYELGVRAADLLDERARLLQAAHASTARPFKNPFDSPHPLATPETPASMIPQGAGAPREATVPRGAQAPPRPAAPLPRPDPRATASPPAPRRSNVQLLLLTLGIGLITAAVLVFATIAYTMLGDAGRAACIGAVGAAAIAVAWALTDRLRVTAEGLMWGGLAALVIDAHLIGATGLIPTPHGVGRSMVTGTLLIAIAVAALAVRALPVRGGMPLRAPACFAVFALVWGAADLVWAFWSGHWSDLGLSLSLIAAVGAALSTLMAAFVPPMRGRRSPDFEWLASMTLAEVGVAAGVMLHVATGIGMDWHGALERMPGLALCVASAVGLLAIARRRRRTGSRTDEAGARPGTRPLAHGWRAVPWIALVVCAARAVCMAQAGLEAMLGSDSPWPRDLGDMATVTVLAAVTLTACLLRRGWVAAERIAAGITGAIMLVAIALIDYQWRFDPQDHRLACSLAALAALCVAMAAVWSRAASLPPWPRTVPSAGISKATGIPSAGIPSAGVPATGVPATTDGPATAPLPADQRPMADAQLINTLQWTIGPAAAFATAAMGVLSMFSPQRPPFPAELPTLMFGVAALATGGVWLARRPMLRSWPALSAGLALTLLPSLAMSWADSGTAALVRATVLGLLAVAAVMWGAAQSLQAPLLIGAVVLVVHVITQLWPLLVMVTSGFWWIWLALDGVVLVVAAARYEHSLNAMRSLAMRFSQLR